MKRIGTGMVLVAVVAAAGSVKLPDPPPGVETVTPVSPVMVTDQVPSGVEFVTLPNVPAP